MGRVPTASERIYREFLNARTKKERARLEGELVAICIAACRRWPRTPPYNKPLSPPYEWQPNPKHDYWKGRWSGGHRSLPSWVRGWVAGELSGEHPLEDGGRHIGRRCVNALIDKIRCHERRKRGAPERFRAWQYDDGLAERQWPRNKVRRAFTKFGLPRKLPIAGDRELLERLIAEYPKRLTNVAIARTLGVTEAAVRKRRKRISQFCLKVVKDPYLLTIVFKQLGLKQGYEKSA
jgi:hypothetical protein